MDHLQPSRVGHSLFELLAQRLYGLALGQEDLVDHGELRDDPLFEVLVGRREIERGRAGKRTLHWFELGVDGPDRPGKITGEESVLKRFSVRSHLGLHREPAGGVLPTAPKKQENGW